MVSGSAAPARGRLKRRGDDANNPPPLFKTSAERLLLFCAVCLGDSAVAGMIGFASV